MVKAGKVAAAAFANEMTKIQRDLLLKAMVEVLVTSRHQLWDALSDILEEPALAIPVPLRRRGLRAIQAAQKAGQKVKELSKELS